MTNILNFEEETKKIVKQRLLRLLYDAQSSIKTITNIAEKNRESFEARLRMTVEMNDNNLSRCYEELYNLVSENFEADKKILVDVLGVVSYEVSRLQAEKESVQTWFKTKNN